MIYGIVYSRKDPAGTGVAAKIKEYLKPREYSLCRDSVECYCGDNYVLACFEEDVIFFDFLDERLPSVDKYIVLSRHSSSAGVKSYTVHHTGNPGNEALYGGRPRSLAVASPKTTYTLLVKLYDYARIFGRDKEYDVSYEATHHGPTEVDKPLTFIEIGSSEEEWNDSVNHEVLARTVIWLLENGELECTPVIGVGGGHYPRKHTALALSKKYCYGHIFAKYSLNALDEELLAKAVERSVPKPEIIVVEKKGTRRQHRLLIEDFASKNNLRVEYV